MDYDFKARRWASDIRSFERYRNMFQTIAKYEGEWVDKHRAHIRGVMNDIQQRWPQFIKVDEIP